MTDTNRSEAQEPADGGLFANLPRTRPGVRSPRRDSAGATVEEHRPAAGKPRAIRPPAARRPPVKPRPAASPPPPPPPPSAEPDEPAVEEDASLEELAWAGVTVAAEAATVGVRLVSRMLEAAREAVERR